MAYTKEILTLAVEIGDCMLRNGAEIYRVEDTVVHILSSYEVEEFDVYVLSNGIFASANENKEDACSIVRHVPLGAVNLAKISALNQLARDICDQKISLIDSWNKNGYTNFYVDIARYLNFGEENEIKVVADNSSEENSRWYSGSGIYRAIFSSNFLSAVTADSALNTDRPPLRQRPRYRDQ